MVSRAICKLLDRDWLLAMPPAQFMTIHPTMYGKSIQSSQLWVLRDDLLHPLISGNKLRKLDGLWGDLLCREQPTDIVTCGGLHSAHTLAVASLCAERGLRSHILIRGIPAAGTEGKITGNWLLTALSASTIKYVSHDAYADRTALLEGYRNELLLTPSVTPIRVSIINEGAFGLEGALGYIRLVKQLASDERLVGRTVHFVIDCGTGASAAGLAIGCREFAPNWAVVGVPLAGTLPYYDAQVVSIGKGWLRSLGLDEGDMPYGWPVTWEPRTRPRRFGHVFPEDVALCRMVCSQTGLVFDPIYSLASWEVATRLAGQGAGDLQPLVILVHTGGMLNLFGVAQRWPQYFSHMHSYSLPSQST